MEGDDKEESLRAAFRTFDQDGSGKISAEELRDVSRYFGNSALEFDRVNVRLVAWHSGRTSVSDWRTFPVLRSTCS